MKLFLNLWGGAHRDKDLILSNVRETISKNLNLYKEMSSEEILDQRKNKFLKIGRTKGFINNPEKLSSLDNKKNSIDQFFMKNKRNILFLIVALLFLLTFLFFQL